MSNSSLPRLFLNATAIGLTMSAALVCALWYFDVNGFHTTLSRSGSGDALLALVLIWVSNGLLFAAVQVGYAMHQLGANHDD